MQILLGNAQHIGSRAEQQDDFGCSSLGDQTFVDHGGVLVVVTDGMGGMAQGREASQVAKHAILEHYAKKTPEEAISDALWSSLLAANARVVEFAATLGLEKQIGTTLVAAVVRGNELYWIAVGDSHIYLCRGQEIRQLNTDHDYAQHLSQAVAQGQMEPEEASNHPWRHALTSYLGIPVLTEIDRNEKPVLLLPGDRILLCSDGLYRTLPTTDIIPLLDQHPQAAAEALVQATLAQGRQRQDNVTVVIIACQGETSSWTGRGFGLTPRRIVVLGMVLLALVGGWAGHRYFLSTAPPLAPLGGSGASPTLLPGVSTLPANSPVPEATLPAQPTISPDPAPTSSKSARPSRKKKRASPAKRSTTAPDRGRQP